MKSLADISRGILKDSIQGLEIGYVSPTELSVSQGAGLNPNGKLLVLDTAFTKTTNSSWTQGTGNGGLVDSIANGAFSTAPDNSIHVFLIQNPTTGLHDIIFCNFLDPVLPSGYTESLYVGGIAFENTNQIYKFSIENGLVVYDFTTSSRVASLPYSFAGAGFVDVTATLPVPSDVETILWVSSIIGEGEQISIYIYANGHLVSRRFMQGYDTSAMIRAGGLITAVANGYSQIRFRIGMNTATPARQLDIDLIGYRLR